MERNFGKENRMRWGLERRRNNPNRFVDFVQIRNQISDLKNQVRTDWLSGALNQRAFRSEIQRCLESDSNDPFSLILLDIDDFKKINDTRGHLFGDNTIIGFCKAMVSGMRITDLFGRIGGDEFAILLPNTDIKERRKVMERLGVLASGLSIKIDSTEEEVCVTFSYGGLTVRQRDWWTMEKMMTFVDRRMYAMKVRKKVGR